MPARSKPVMRTARVSRVDLQNWHFFSPHAAVLSGQASCAATNRDTSKLQLHNGFLAVVMPTGVGRETSALCGRDVAGVWGKLSMSLCPVSSLFGWVCVLC